MQIVKGAQIGVQIRKFEQNADFLKKLPGMCALHIFSEQRHHSAVTLQYAGQYLLRRGLAGAVWS